MLRKMQEEMRRENVRLIDVDGLRGVRGDEEWEKGGGEGADWGSSWAVMTFIYVESNVRNGRERIYRFGVSGRT